tara:strand:+ start:195 stop:536 length:342 start_codon:yes stop_codon:yes gene_type:complete
MTTVTRNEGFDGLMRLLSAQDIERESWLAKPIIKERGGMEIILPQVSGEIYLGWEDLYKVDITFVSTKQKYEAVLSLADTKEVIKQLEAQRVRHVGQIRDLIKTAFSKKDEEE